MLSYQAREYYEFLFEKFKNFEEHINIILEFGDKYKENTTNTLKKVIGTTLTTTDGNGTHYIVKGGQVIEGFKNVVKEFKGNFNFFEVFSEYTIFKNDISRYINENKIIDNTINDFFGTVDSFFKLYQEFMQSDNNIELAINFGQCVKEISTLYVTLQKVYESFNYNLSSYEDIEINREDSKRLEIQLLDVEFTVEEFAKKLIVFNELYEDITNIVDNKAIKMTKRLKIIKIESGSELIDVIGNPISIIIITAIINELVKLAFKKFNEKKQTLTHNEIKELVQRELANNDIDVNKNTERVEKIVKSSFEFVRGSTKIKVNKEVHTINESNKDKYLTENNKKLLDTGDKK